MVGYKALPKWLKTLMKEEFFEECLVHKDVCDKKAEKNLFCFDCCCSACQLCLSHHRKHVLLQVRRYVYHDVLKLSDAQKLMDCSGIQSYITNSAKVIFLRQRPMLRSHKGSPSLCFTCNRRLQDPFLFCCLSCKVEHIVSTQGSLRINLSDQKMLSFTDMDECQFTSDSVLDSRGSIPTSSGSTMTSDLRTALLCTATSEVVRKKRSIVPCRHGPTRTSVCSQVTENSMNRRKGVPNRAPLC